MPPAHGQLTALAELITQATKVIEAAYAKTEKPYVPSLEDTEAHPLDDTIYSEELRRAVQTIEGACAQLVATVGKPSHTVVNVSRAVSVSQDDNSADIVDAFQKGMAVSCCCFIVCNVNTETRSRSLRRAVSTSSRPSKSPMSFRQSLRECISQKSRRRLDWSHERLDAFCVCFPQDTSSLKV